MINWKVHDRFSKESVTTRIFTSATHRKKSNVTAEPDCSVHVKFCYQHVMFHLTYIYYLTISMCISTTECDKHG